MISRSLSWMLVALGLGAFGANRASAQNDASSPLPAGTTACEFSALARQGEPGGPALRDAPRSDGRELGRLPAIKDKDTGFYGQDGELPEFRVIGFKDGWFLIEDAAYPEPYRPKLHTGRGWIDAKLVTTHLFRDTLKKAPDNASPDVTLSPWHERRHCLPALRPRCAACRMLRPVVRGRDPSAERKDPVRKACLGGWNGARLDGQVVHGAGPRSVQRQAVRLSLVAAAGRRDGVQFRRAQRRSRPGRPQCARGAGPERPRPGTPGSRPRASAAAPSSWRRFT